MLAEPTGPIGSSPLTPEVLRKWVLRQRPGHRVGLPAPGARQEPPALATDGAAVEEAREAVEAIETITLGIDAMDQ
ncbi:MAG TPA: hypothetical protein GXZ30_02615 [Propionibacterium sp.]|nr:hypothetical protein [Propionibacterium sp.]